MRTIHNILIGKGSKANPDAVMNFASLSKIKTIFSAVLVFLLVSIAPAEATHLVGGSITYTYIGKSSNYYTYSIKVDMFRDCSTPAGQSSPTPFDNTINVGIYERTGDTSLYKTLSINLASDESVNPPQSGCCGSSGSTSTSNICIHEGIYNADVQLPASAYGYYLVYARCCRNTMVNVPINIGQTYFAIIPPTNIINNTPQFTAVPAPYVCANDTISLSYSTVDPDGDSLVYSLAQPYAGGDQNTPSPPPSSNFNTFNIQYNTNTVDLPLVPYNSGFSPQYPMGIPPTIKGYASIDKVTGVLTVYASINGRYAIAVDVKEYRNGKYISKTRRDVQLIVVGGCGLNGPPKRVTIADTITVDKTLISSYKVEAGTKLIFGIRYAADNSKKSPCPINIVNVVKAGFINNTSGFTYTPTLSPVVYDTINHEATTYFTWQTTCKDVSSNPYTFTLTVTDNACPPKTTNNGFAIYVVPFQGAKKIEGPSPVCEGTPASLYSTNYQQKGYQLTWNVSNGTYSSGPNDSSINVIWGHYATGTIKVLGKNTLTGCAGDSVIRTININPKPSPPTIAGPTGACDSASSTYSIPSGANSNYSWTVAGGKITKANTQNQTIQITWNKADTNKISVSAIDSNGCKSDTSFKSINVQRPIADSIYGSYSVCPNASNIDYWVTSQAGSAYYWTIIGGTKASGGNTSHIKINWGSKGGGLVEVVEVTSNGCPGDTIKLKVLKDYILYTSPIKGDTSVCEFSNNVPYSVTNSNGSTYKWKITGGTIISGQGTANILVDWNNAGAGALIVTETAYDALNHDSCIGIPVSDIIKIYPLPNSSEISGPKGICEGAIALFSVTGLPGSTYIWKFNGKTSIYTTDTARFQETGLTSLTDVVDVSVSEISKDRCPGTTRHLLLTVHKLPVTSAITGPDLVCAPKLNDAVYSVTGFPNSTFNWTVTGGAIASGDKTNAVTINWMQQGDESISVQEVTDFGCISPVQTKPLKVKIDSLSVDMQLVTTDYNNDKEIDVYWSAKNTGFFNGYYLIYRSTDGEEFFRLIDSVPSSQTNFTDTHVNTAAYAYKYKVVAVNSCGYPISSEAHRTIKLSGIFDEDTTIHIDWNPYVGWPVDVYNIYDSKNTDPGLTLYNFTKDTSYAVIKTLDGYQLALRVSATESGLKNVVSWSNKIYIEFTPIVWIPNAFTPQNGDNLNNTFHVFVANYKTYQINIYNRWGEHIFSSTDPDMQWDGTFKGSICDEGVYLYQVIVDGARTAIYRSGTVNLMR